MSALPLPTSVIMSTVLVLLAVMMMPTVASAQSEGVVDVQATFDALDEPR